MNCREVRILLPEYLGEQLSGEERSVVRDHIAVCRDCRSEARELDALLRDLKLPELPEPDERYFATLLPRINQRIGERSAWKVPRWVPSVAMPLAAAALIVITLLNVVPSSRQGTTAEDLRGILSQITTDPQEALEEVQNTSGILSTSGDVSAQADTANEKDIVNELLNGDVRTGYTIEFDLRQYVEKLDKQSTNQLLALLDERIPSH